MKENNGEVKRNEKLLQAINFTKQEYKETLTKLAVGEENASTDVDTSDANEA